MPPRPISSITRYAPSVRPVSEAVSSRIRSAPTPHAGSSRKPSVRSWLARRDSTSRRSSGSPAAESRTKASRAAGSSSSAAWNSSLMRAPALGAHACEVPSSSRASHARATAQCRFTVAGEMSIASAVSSIVSPPKKRSSTRRACSGVERAQPLQRLRRAQ